LSGASAESAYSLAIWSRTLAQTPLSSANPSKSLARTSYLANLSGASAEAPPSLAI